MTNFNLYDEREWLKEQLDEMNVETPDIRSLLDISELCAVESWASEQNLYFNGHYIDSEQALSDLFDEDTAPHVIREYPGDTPAFDQAFNDWSDGLTRDGQLHPAQYSGYCYVGKHGSE